MESGLEMYTGWMSSCWHEGEDKIRVRSWNEEGKRKGLKQEGLKKEELGKQKRNRKRVQCREDAE